MRDVRAELQRRADYIAKLFDAPFHGHELETLSFVAQALFRDARTACTTFASFLLAARAWALRAKRSCHALATGESGEAPPHVDRYAGEAGTSSSTLSAVGSSICTCFPPLEIMRSANTDKVLSKFLSAEGAEDARKT